MSNSCVIIFLNVRNRTALTYRYIFLSLSSSQKILERQRNMLLLCFSVDLFRCQ